MGNRFELSVVRPSNEDSLAAEDLNAAIQEIKRIEQLLSTYREDSQVNAINRMAGIEPVRVDREVLSLIQRANRISELTQGAFDISYGSIDISLWNFDKEMKALPDKNIAASRVRLINFRNIIVNVLCY